MTNTPFASCQLKSLEVSVFDWQQLAGEAPAGEPTRSHPRTSNSTILARSSVYRAQLPLNVCVRRSELFL